KEHRRRKANRRLIILLTVFFLLIAFVVYIQSPLSQINRIDVNGIEIVTKKEAKDISALKKGDNIWKINRKQAVKNLLSLPEIKSAEVLLKFPNNIVINIKEYSPIALLVSQENFRPVLENGTILEKNTILTNGPLLLNFKEGNI